MFYICAQVSIYEVRMKEVNRTAEVPLGKMIQEVVELVLET